MRQLLTKAALAKLLCLTTKTLDRLRKAGHLRALRVGGRIRFDPDEVTAYLDRQREQGPALPAEDCVGGLTVDEPCEQHPAYMGKTVKARWSCLNPACACREILTREDYGGRTLPKSPPALKCPFLRSTVTPG